MNRLFSPKDLRDYSLGRAITDIVNTGGPVGLEKEIHQELSTYNKRTHQIPTDGIAVPIDAFARDMTTGVSAQGGALVQSTKLTMVDILRNKSVVLRNNATFIRDLKSGAFLPRQSGTASVSWLSETGGASEADGTFDTLPLTPHRITGQTNYSVQLFRQTNEMIEQVVQNDLTELISVALDGAAVLGTGSSNQPRGIVNTTGVGSITLGGPASFSNIVEFERTLAATGNVDTSGPQPPVWIASPNTRAKLRQRPRQSSGVEGNFVWPESGNEMLGYKAEVSNQLTSTHQLIFVWMPDVVVAMFGGAFDMVIDPYTLAATRQIKVTINAFADVVLRHASSATVSSDSAAQ